jgi:hypothetical protein
MTIALFPLEIARTDDNAGIVARQLWRAVRAVVPTAPLNLVVWLARRGDTPAHVVLESPLPLSVVRGEAATRSCPRSVVGRLEVSPLHTSIATRWVDDTEERPGPSVRERSLREAVLALAGALFPDHAPEPDRLPQRDDALRAWMTDADNAVVIDAGGVDALARPEDAYRPLVALLASEPSFTPAADMLRARRDAWAADGARALAAACATALADATDTDEDRAAAALLTEPGTPDASLPPIERP